MRLALDHHYSPRIAEHLRSRGVDAVAAIEVGWHGDDDAVLLDRCAAADRALVTNNVADFAVLGRDWAATGLRHAGLVFTSDRSLPRSNATIGTYVDLLAALVEAEVDGLADRIHWLG